MEAVRENKTVCVTGAGGFLASWLVKLLLSKGYTVHGTVRDPSHERNSHLGKLEKASENLKLFKTELNDKDAIEAAVSGCEGVFHVASPNPGANFSNPEVEIIIPAVEGTENVLIACKKTNVKRVVVVSSIAALALNPSWPKGTMMDENCWSDEDFCRKIQMWYCLAKTQAEKRAFELAHEYGLHLITVCPSTVFGPLLQCTVNTSTSTVIDILKGSLGFIKNYRSWHFVDVRDVAEALLLLYENPIASGRYNCSLDPIKIIELVDLLKKMYPSYNYPTNLEIGQESEMTSEKLKKIGWKPRPLEESIADFVKYCKDLGLLSLE